MDRLQHVLIVFFTLGLISLAGAQIPKQMRSLMNASPASGPGGNAINGILILDNDVWVAAGLSLSRTSDNGHTWTDFTRDDGLGRGNVIAIAGRNDTIWTATAFDSTTVLGTLDVGGGLSYSTDGGLSWHWIPQPVDSADVTEYRPITTEVLNVTWDIALADSAVWIASWGGGLRRSMNMGESWEVVTVDGLPFNADAHLAHLAFAVVFDGTALWVGTAGGVHKSTDGGETWTTFSHQNQPEGISGNFVVAIGRQITDEKNVVWARTAEASDASEYRGISKSEDGGLTWTVPLEGVLGWNFAFDAEIVYVAADEGLYKSLDYGDTWAVFPQIVDSETGERVYAREVYSVAVGGDGGLWVGTGDGLALTLDDGLTWKIFRAFQETGTDGVPETYAYPNPFSPLRHNVAGGDGHVRFQYRTHGPASVNVRVYDFGMNLVRTVVAEKERPVAGDYAEVWDGRNDVGDMVANGVYFYNIRFSNGAPLWGKVMVVN